MLKKRTAIASDGVYSKRSFESNHQFNGANIAAVNYDIAMKPFFVEVSDKSPQSPKATPGETPQNEGIEWLRKRGGGGSRREEAL